MYYVELKLKRALKNITVHQLNIGKIKIIKKTDFNNYCSLTYFKNGILTTFALMAFSRIKMNISVSVLEKEVFTYPMPIALFKVGDCEPDVTLPIIFPAASAI